MMKMSRGMKILGAYFAIGFVLLTIANVDWGARNLLSEIGWELSAQLMHAGTMAIPLALAIIIGRKIESSAWAWGIGFAIFFSTAALGLVLIEESPHQIKWRVEAMRNSSPDYDGGRR